MIATMNADWATLGQRLQNYTDAAVLLFILEKEEEAELDADGFFLCKAEAIEKGLDMWHDKRARAVRRLVKAGLLEVRHGRYFTLHVKVVKEKLAEVLS